MGLYFLSFALLYAVRTRLSFSKIASVSYNSGYATIQVAFVREEEEGWGGGGGGMINYANYFGESTFFLHLEWGGSLQNW